MRQAQQLGNFVERLTRGIVDRPAKPMKFVRPIGNQKLAMPAGHQQDQIGKGQIVCQARCQGMPGQMIDPDQRQAGCNRQALGNHDPGQNPADQPRPCRDRDGVDLAQPKTCGQQCAFHTMIQPFNMGAGGNFGHDAAKIGMQGRLPLDHRRKNDRGHAGRMPDHGRRRIIAAAFQSQNGQNPVHCHPLPKAPCAGNTSGMAVQSHALPQILLTRPAEQSQRFAKSLHDRLGPDLRIAISALLAAQFLDPQVPAMDWAALILTSETAALSARRLSAQGIKLPQLAFSVGDRTAAVAAELGMDPVSAHGDAEALLTLILSQRPTGPLLHLRGEDGRGDLANRLISAGFETVECVTYRQDPAKLTAEACTLLLGNTPVICPVFSPRSAAILQGECLRIRAVAPVTLIALSPAVAAGWTNRTGPVITAHRPNAASMMDAIAMHLESVGKA